MMFKLLKLALRFLHSALYVSNQIPISIDWRSAAATIQRLKRPRNHKFAQRNLNASRWISDLVIPAGELANPKATRYARLIAVPVKKLVNCSEW
ncbi:hypothetical protein AX760_12760 [Pararhizobium antarcticum]|uniref:Uncharacterized protein n=1 Tax=Pararhizobium antarcticum TaxID=1798805 RepID=A0A657LVV6_9HYPH|nr:hypothetical protein AX761_19230 [Rhizobium sp. 58]OJF99607.1 hypothetical protein AX760_12760 [Pararhizobium antarcticum]